MAEKKIVNITPNEEEYKDELEQEQVNPDPPKEEPKDETKEEPKKEFFLIRGAKAVGRGVAKTGKAINGFVHEHPVASSIISGGLGFAAKYGWDYLMTRGEESEACSSVAEDVDVPMLTMDEPEDEMMEFSTQEETPVENVVEE